MRTSEQSVLETVKIIISEHLKALCYTYHSVFSSCWTPVARLPKFIMDGFFFVFFLEAKTDVLLDQPCVRQVA